MPDLLLELFSEEIPARFQRKAAGDLRKLVTDALVDAGLTYEGAKEYWTPRRLTLDVRGLTPKSADIKEERKGPRTDAPEKAIEGFLRGAGLASIDEATVKSDPKKGDFYVAVIEKPGRDAKDIIADVMPGIIRNFPWPKSMRWGEQSREAGSLKWVRPLHSIICTFGPETEEPEVIPFEVSGITASNKTQGHRFLSPKGNGGEITVKRFEDYVSKLEKAKVILDAERRKEMILADAKNLAFAQGFDLVEDAGLLEEVGNLVEWPTVLMGEFDEAFLDIPSEVIQLTIRENQKCFVVRRQGSGSEERPAIAPARSGGEAAHVSENKALANRFILVSNIVPSDGGTEVTRGNGKVVAARLSDAKFFWESDLQQTGKDGGFEEWVKGLDEVTFHAKLGSQGERVGRIVALAEELASVVANSSLSPLAGEMSAQQTEGGNATRVSENELVQQAKRAAFLAKADLQSAMVYEVPEMQGKIGRIYAEKAGENASVALAIEEHYKPLGPTDDVPTDPVSVTVALADKLDTLVGFWAIDEKPTGSKDPFALRRAALGVIRLVVENGVRLGLLDFCWIVYSELRKQIRKRSNYYNYHRVIDNKVTNSQRSLIWEDEVPLEFNKIQCWNDPKAKEIFQGSVTQIPIENFVANISLPAFAIPDLLSFFHDRLKVFLKDEGIRHDVLDAVLAPTSPLWGGRTEGPGGGRAEGANSNDDVPPPSIPPHKGEGGQNDDLLIITQKARALQKLVDTDDGVNLIQGYKRAATMLGDEEKKGAAIADAINSDLFENDEERALFETLEDVEKLAANAIEAENFEEAMSRLASLRAPIDNFFEHVHVNADDEAIRANRLALLASIRAATATVADLSKVSG